MENNINTTATNATANTYATDAAANQPTMNIRRGKKAMKMVKNNLDPMGLVPLKETFGRNLYMIRNARGIAKKKLAKQVGFAYSTVSNWEKGVTMPDAPVILKLAEFLQVNYITLIDEEKAKEFVASLPYTPEEAKKLEAAALNTDKNVEDRLDDLLKAQGVSKRSFTKQMGTNAIELHKTLSDIQKTVYAIAHALGTPVDALFSNSALIAAISNAA